LNNVAEVSDREWAKLRGFVSDGGGLVIGLGSHTLAERYQGPTADQVLPAALDRLATSEKPTFLGQVADNTHPLFPRYPRELNEMLAQIPVSRYWLVAPRGEARVLLSYADKSPALVERVFKGSKTGRVMLWSTPLSRRADPNSPDAWNEFPNPILGW